MPEEVELNPMILPEEVELQDRKKIEMQNHRGTETFLGLEIWLSPKHRRLAVSDFAFQFDYDPEWTNQKRVFPSPPIGRLASGS